MRYRKILLTIFIIIMLCFTGCSAGGEVKQPGDSVTGQGQETSEALKPTPEPSHVTVTETTAATDPIAEQIKHMTLAEKLGQMIIVGLDGYEMDENTRTMIRDHHIGGFIFFRSNVKNSQQLLSLVNSLKEENSGNDGIPLFISVDEEGGRISRMPEDINKLPAALETGKSSSGELAYDIGRLLALETGAFGFNTDFAPVLDILSNRENTVIGDRAYGSDAETVSKMGIQVMKGMREGGVIPVVKHFPGHGDTSIDSHIGLPAVDYDMERLSGFELVPFKAAVDNGAEAVMVGHISMKKIDPDYPASLSKTVITDVLRDGMGYDGVVITDDMTMGAIIKNFDIGDAAVKSVLAGTDIVLVCHGYERKAAVLEALLNAAKEGVITQQRIDESLYRILKLKAKYRLKDSIIEDIDIGAINERIDEVLAVKAEDVNE